MVQFGISFITDAASLRSEINTMVDSNLFPLQNAIKKILDNPTTRPVLPVLKDGTSVRDGTSVGDENFGEAHRYGTGISPDIALNNGNVVVEVHQTEGKGSTLWYHVGKVEGKKIIWGGSINYDKGVQPSVAITDDGLVVEVHKSQNHDTLWYHVGKIEGDKITWGVNAQYDEGVQPSVAITDDGLVVEVHKSQNHDTLWYHVGKIESDKITWGVNAQYDKGVQPSVAITDDGLVVEVHKSQNHDTLWYHVGKIEGDKITWGVNAQYDKGVQPSVAITNDGLVVEVHKSEGLLGHLWYRLGQVESNTITWRNDGKSIHYADGDVAKVACNAQLAVETHSNKGNIDDSPSSRYSLKCSVLTLPAFRSNWIELYGDNSYCYCACNSAADNKDRHASSHRMSVKEGAPYFYAVLTKDDDSIDFPTGAILAIEGPDGTKYNRDIQEEDQLVLMSGSSVRCLIVKDPKPGDWKMTMTVPEGVGFHCECNTVPSKDVYDTMTGTLDNSLQKRGLSIGKSVELWGGLTALGALLFSEVEVPVLAVRALWMVVSTGIVSHVLPGDTQTGELSRDDQIQVGKGVGKTLGGIYKNKGIKKATEWVKNTASRTSKKKKKVKQYVYAVAHNGQGDFIIGFKNRFGWFFHTNGGVVLPPPGQQLNGGDDYVFPGGELEESEDPIVGAWREIFEETNEHLGGWIAQPDLYEGQEPPGSPEPRIRYYGVYFNIGDQLLPLFETISGNLVAGGRAAQAVIRGEFQGNYHGLLQAFDGCPPDNELNRAYLWNFRDDWQTIQGWQNDRNKSWYYYILNNLRNQLGITG